MRRFFLFMALLATAACSGSTISLGAPSGGDAGADSSAATADASPGDSTARVIVRLRASAAPVAHTDGFSGETPITEHLAIRSLTLLRAAADPSPLTVFDLGAAPVEAGLDDGNDTLIAAVPAASLVRGTFTIARVGVSFARYRVATTMHQASVALPGELDCVQVFSDGVVLDGVARAKGWYSTTFTSGGTSYGTQTGLGAALPPQAGPFVFDTSGPLAEYVFPATVLVEPTIAHDVNVIFSLNTHEDFRWQDQAELGYAPGVFDATATSTEPIKSFVANSFTISVE